MDDDEDYGVHTNDGGGVLDVFGEVETVSDWEGAEKEHGNTNDFLHFARAVMRRCHRLGAIPHDSFEYHNNRLLRGEIERWWTHTMPHALRRIFEEAKKHRDTHYPQYYPTEFFGHDSRFELAAMYRVVLQYMPTYMAHFPRDCVEILFIMITFAEKHVEDPEDYSSEEEGKDPMEKVREVVLDNLPNILSNFIEVLDHPPPNSAAAHLASLCADAPADANDAAAEKATWTTKTTTSTTIGKKRKSSSVSREDDIGVGVAVGNLQQAVRRLRTARSAMRASKPSSRGARKAPPPPAGFVSAADGRSRVRATSARGNEAESRQQAEHQAAASRMRPGLLGGAQNYADASQRNPRPRVAMQDDEEDEDDDSDSDDEDYEDDEESDEDEEDGGEDDGESAEASDEEEEEDEDEEDDHAGSKADEKASDAEEEEEDGATDSTMALPSSPSDDSAESDDKDSAEQKRKAAAKRRRKRKRTSDAEDGSDSDSSGKRKRKDLRQRVAEQNARKRRAAAAAKTTATPEEDEDVARSSDGGGVFVDGKDLEDAKDDGSDEYDPSEEEDDCGTDEAEMLALKRKREAKKKAERMRLKREARLLQEDAKRKANKKRRVQAPGPEDADGEGEASEDGEMAEHRQREGARQEHYRVPAAVAADKRHHRGVCAKRSKAVRRPRHMAKAAHERKDDNDGMADSDDGYNPQQARRPPTRAPRHHDAAGGSYKYSAAVHSHSHRNHASAAGGGVHLLPPPSSSEDVEDDGVPIDGVVGFEGSSDEELELGELPYSPTALKEMREARRIRALEERFCDVDYLPRRPPHAWDDVILVQRMVVCAVKLFDMDAVPSVSAAVAAASANAAGEHATPLERVDLSIELQLLFCMKIMDGMVNLDESKLKHLKPLEETAKWTRIVMDQLPDRCKARENAINKYMADAYPDDTDFQRAFPPHVRPGGDAYGLSEEKASEAAYYGVVNTGGSLPYTRRRAAESAAAAAERRRLAATKGVAAGAAADALLRRHRKQLDDVLDAYALKGVETARRLPAFLNGDESEAVMQDSSMLEWIPESRLMPERLFVPNRVVMFIHQRIFVDMALKRIQCSFLNQRLHGLNTLLSMVDLSVEGEKKAREHLDAANVDYIEKLRRMAQARRDKNVTPPSSPPRKPKPLCPGAWSPLTLANELRRRRIVPILFGDTYHFELLKRSQPILDLLASRDVLTAEDIDCMWRASQQKHHAVRQDIYRMMAHGAQHMRVWCHRRVFAKIRAIPIEKMDYGLIEFSVRFTFYLASAANQAINYQPRGACEVPYKTEQLVAVLPCGPAAAQQQDGDTHMAAGSDTEDDTASTNAAKGSSDRSSSEKGKGKSSAPPAAALLRDLVSRVPEVPKEKMESPVRERLVPEFEIFDLLWDLFVSEKASEHMRVHAYARIEDVLRWPLVKCMRPLILERCFDNLLRRRQVALSLRLVEVLLQLMAAEDTRVTYEPILAHYIKHGNFLRVVFDDLIDFSRSRCVLANGGGGVSTGKGSRGRRSPRDGDDVSESVLSPTMNGSQGPSSNAKPSALPNSQSSAAPNSQQSSASQKAVAAAAVAAAASSASTLTAITVSPIFNEFNFKPLDYDTFHKDRMEEKHEKDEKSPEGVESKTSPSSAPTPAALTSENLKLFNQVKTTLALTFQNTSGVPREAFPRIDKYPAGDCTKDAVYQLRQRLNFLHYVCYRSPSIYLTKEYLAILWDNFVVKDRDKTKLPQPSSSVRDAIFEWFERVIPLVDSSERRVIFFDAVEYVFERLIPTLDFADLTEKGFSFFKTFFVFINQHHRIFEPLLMTNQFRMLKVEVKGMELLWEIALCAKRVNVASLAMSLIYKMHTTFDDSIKDRINDKYEESIKTVMGRLTANANDSEHELEVERCFQLLELFLEKFEGERAPKHVSLPPVPRDFSLGGAVVNSPLAPISVANIGGGVVAAAAKGATMRVENPEGSPVVAHMKGNTGGSLVDLTANGLVPRPNDENDRPLSVHVLLTSQALGAIENPNSIPTLVASHGSRHMPLFKVSMRRADNVLKLRHKVAAATRLPPETLILVSRGRLLSDTEPLASIVKNPEVDPVTLMYRNNKNFGPAASTNASAPVAATAAAVTDPRTNVPVLPPAPLDLNGGAAAVAQPHARNIAARSLTAPPVKRKSGLNMARRGGKNRRGKPIPQRRVSQHVAPTKSHYFSQPPQGGAGVNRKLDMGPEYANASAPPEPLDSKATTRVGLTSPPLASASTAPKTTHPSVILSQLQYLEQLFSLLNCGNSRVAERCWMLLMKLPTHSGFLKSFHELAPDWRTRLSPTGKYGIFGFRYALQIIDALSKPPATKFGQFMSKAEMAQIRERTKWRNRFLLQNGVSHLVDIMLTYDFMPEASSRSSTTGKPTFDAEFAQKLSCTDLMLQLVARFVADAFARASSPGAASAKSLLPDGLGAAASDARKVRTFTVPKLLPPDLLSALLRIVRRTAQLASMNAAAWGAKLEQAMPTGSPLIGAAGALLGMANGAGTNVPPPPPPPPADTWLPGSAASMYGSQQQPIDLSNPNAKPIGPANSPSLFSSINNNGGGGSGGGTMIGPALPHQGTTTTSLFLNTNSNPAATTTVGPGGAEAAQLCFNVVKTSLDLMKVMLTSDDSALSERIFTHEGHRALRRAAKPSSGTASSSSSGAMDIDTSPLRPVVKSKSASSSSHAVADEDDLVGWLEDVLLRCSLATIRKACSQVLQEACAHHLKVVNDIVVSPLDDTTKENPAPEGLSETSLAKTETTRSPSRSPSKSLPAAAALTLKGVDPRLHLFFFKRLLDALRLTRRPTPSTGAKSTPSHHESDMLINHNAQAAEIMEFTNRLLRDLQAYRESGMPKELLRYRAEIDSIDFGAVFVEAVGRLDALPTTENFRRPKPNQALSGLAKLATVLCRCMMHEAAASPHDAASNRMSDDASASTSSLSVSERAIKRSQAIDVVFRRLLFDIPSKFDRGDNAPPQCKLPHSREAAFALLHILSKSDPRSCQELFSLLAAHHKSPPYNLTGMAPPLPTDDRKERERRTPLWNFEPAGFRKSASGYVGLENMGATCYMNSLLQQLFMIPEFRYGILSQPLTPPKSDKDEEKAKKAKEKEARRKAKEADGTGALLMSDDEDEDEEEEEEISLNDSLLYQLQVTFANLQESACKAYKPLPFTLTYKDYEGNPMNTGLQMDVDEFFTQFFEKLENAFKGGPHEKLLNHLFGGKLANQLIGRDCPHYRERPEEFFKISLDVKGNKSILDSLKMYIQSDILEGDNKYYCNECKEKVNTEKRVCIKELPKNLVLHLKRFEFDMDYMRKMKVNDYCEFPEILDMKPYTQRGLELKEGKVYRPTAPPPEKKEGEEENAAEDEEKPLGSPFYKLAGMLVHQGVADAGHYYSFVKERVPLLGSTARRPRSQSRADAADSAASSTSSPPAAKRQRLSAVASPPRVAHLSTEPTSSPLRRSPRRASSRPKSPRSSPSRTATSPSRRTRSPSSSSRRAAKASPSPRRRTSSASASSSSRLGAAAESDCSEDDEADAEEEHEPPLHWYQFNDSSVDEFNFEKDLKDACFGGTENSKIWDSINPVQRPLKCNNAYMLFYERIEEGSPLYQHLTGQTPTSSSAEAAPSSSAANPAATSSSTSSSPSKSALCSPPQTRKRRRSASASTPPRIRTPAALGSPPTALGSGGLSPLRSPPALSPLSPRSRRRRAAPPATDFQLLLGGSGDSGSPQTSSTRPISDRALLSRPALMRAFRERIQRGAPEEIPHFLSMGEASSLVPPHIFNHIWEANTALLTHQHVFDLRYFAFCKQVFTTSEVFTSSISTYDIPDLASLDIARVKFAVDFLANTLARWRSSPPNTPGTKATANTAVQPSVVGQVIFDGLRASLRANVPASRWLMDYFEKSSHLQECLVRCNHSFVRRSFAELLLSVMQTLRVHEKGFYEKTVPLSCRKHLGAIVPPPPRPAVAVTVAEEADVSSDNDVSMSPSQSPTESTESTSAALERQDTVDYSDMDTSEAPCGDENRQNGQQAVVISPTAEVNSSPSSSTPARRRLVRRRVMSITQTSPRPSPPSPTPTGRSRERQREREREQKEGKDEKDEKEEVASPPVVRRRSSRRQAAKAKAAASIVADTSDEDQTAEEEVAQSHVANFLIDFIPKLHQNSSRLKNLEEAFSLLLHFAAQGPEEVQFLLEQQYLATFFKFYNANFGPRDSKSKNTTKQERTRTNNKLKFGPFLSLISLMITSLPQKSTSTEKDDGEDDDLIDMTVPQQSPSVPSPRRVFTTAEEKAGNGGKDDEKQRELDSLACSSFKEKVSYRAKHILTHMKPLEPKWIMRHIAFFKHLLLEEPRHPMPGAARAILAHLCYNNHAFGKVIFNQIAKICSDLYHQQIEFVLDVAEDIMMLDDGLRNRRIVEFMPELLKAIKANEPLDSESRVLFGWLAKAVKKIPGVCQWLFLNKDKWFNVWIGAPNTLDRKARDGKTVNVGHKSFNQHAFQVVEAIAEVDKQFLSTAEGIRQSSEMMTVLAAQATAEAAAKASAAAASASATVDITEKENDPSASSTSSSGGDASSSSETKSATSPKGGEPDSKSKSASASANPPSSLLLPPKKREPLDLRHSAAFRGEFRDYVMKQMGKNLECLKNYDVRFVRLKNTTARDKMQCIGSDHFDTYIRAAALFATPHDLFKYFFNDSGYAMLRSFCMTIIDDEMTRSLELCQNKKAFVDLLFLMMDADESGALKRHLTLRDTEIIRKLYDCHWWARTDMPEYNESVMPRLYQLVLMVLETTPTAGGPMPDQLLDFVQDLIENNVFQWTVSNVASRREFKRCGDTVLPIIKFLNAHYANYSDGQTSWSTARYQMVKAIANAHHIRPSKTSLRLVWNLIDGCAYAVVPLKEKEIIDKLMQFEMKPAGKHRTHDEWRALLYWAQILNVLMSLDPLPKFTFTKKWQKIMVDIVREVFAFQAEALKAANKPKSHEERTLHSYAGTTFAFILKFVRNILNTAKKSGLSKDLGERLHTELSATWAAFADRCQLNIEIITAQQRGEQTVPARSSISDKPVELKVDEYAHQLLMGTVEGQAIHWHAVFPEHPEWLPLYIDVVSHLAGWTSESDKYRKLQIEMKRIAADLAFVLWAYAIDTKRPEQADRLASLIYTLYDTDALPFKRMRLAKGAITFTFLRHATSLLTPVKRIRTNDKGVEYETSASLLPIIQRCLHELFFSNDRPFPPHFFVTWVGHLFGEALTELVCLESAEPRKLPAKSKAKAKGKGASPPADDTSSPSPKDSADVKMSDSSDTSSNTSGGGGASHSSDKENSQAASGADAGAEAASSPRSASPASTDSKGAAKDKKARKPKGNFIQRAMGFFSSRGVPEEEEGAEAAQDSSAATSGAKGNGGNDGSEPLHPSLQKAGAELNGSSGRAVAAEAEGRSGKGAGAPGKKTSALVENGKAPVEEEDAEEEAIPADFGYDRNIRLLVKHLVSLYMVLRPEMTQPFLRTDLRAELERYVHQFSEKIQFAIQALGEEYSNPNSKEYIDPRRKAYIRRFLEKLRGSFPAALAHCQNNWHAFDLEAYKATLDQKQREQQLAVQQHLQQQQLQHQQAGGAIGPQQEGAVIVDDEGSDTDAAMTDVEDGAPEATAVAAADKERRKELRRRRRQRRPSGSILASSVGVVDDAEAGGAEVVDISENAGRNGKDRSSIVVTSVSVPIEGKLATADVDGVPMVDVESDASGCDDVDVGGAADVEPVPADPPAETLKLAGGAVPVAASTEAMVLGEDDDVDYDNP